MLIGVGVSCRISYSIVGYLYVSFNGLITSVGEERALLSVKRSFLFFSMLRIGCVILFRHSLGPPAFDIIILRSVVDVN